MTLRGSPYQLLVTLLPTVWHETGVELRGTIGQARYQLQAVTALDSTGFSGYGFISNGVQNKLEVRNASVAVMPGMGEQALLGMNVLKHFNLAQEGRRLTVSPAVGAR